MAKGFPKGLVNMASDFYNGAVKGTKKASFTVNRVASKNRMVQNLDVTKAIDKSKNIAAKNAEKGMRINNNIKRVPSKSKVVMEPTTSAKVGNWAGGGTRDSIKAYKNMGDSDKSMIDAIKKGHKKVGADGKLLEDYDMGKIAGTTFSVGVAGRIATGGGLYRDRYGNVNLPGVPFI